jgi:hypothetical protein
VTIALCCMASRRYLIYAGDGGCAVDQIERYRCTSASRLHSQLIRHPWFPYICDHLNLSFISFRGQQ